MKFYMTYDHDRPDVILPLAEYANIPIMKNTASRWSEAQEDFLPMNNYPEDTPIAIDSGGFNVQSNYGDYPWTVEQYHKWLENMDIDFDWAACMDYACEERFDDSMSVEERIDRTIENTIEQFEMDRSYNLLPVIQGRTIDQWLNCYDRLKDHGIPMDYVGIGTVCRQSNSHRIVEIEETIREGTTINKLHGFGVKINAYKYGASFDSADSQAWAYAPTHGRVGLYHQGGYEEFETADRLLSKMVTFYSYYLYVKDLSKDKERGNDVLDW